MAENAASGEENPEQVEVRKHKLDKLKAAGVPVYPNDFRPTHTAAELLFRYGGASDEELSGAPKDLRIAGRILS